MNKRRFGFTLVELLVVLTIIAVLASIVLAITGKIRERGNSAGTISNMRQIAAAFLLFAGEHNGTLPGNYDTRDKQDGSGNPLPEWTTSWLTGYNNDQDEMQRAPEKGTIYPYINNPKVYRAVGLPVREKGRGGSNGKFDFAMMLRLAGANLINVPAHCTLRGKQMATPLLIHEDADRYINGDYREGAHGFSDQAATIYGGGSYYAAIDGTVHFVLPPEGEPYKASEWMAIAPSGNERSLGQPNVTEFGEWNSD